MTLRHTLIIFLYQIINTIIFSMKIKQLLASLAIAALPALAANGQSMPTYMDTSRPIEERVTDALKRMTTEEKIAIIHAQSKFSSPGVERLGIPELWTSDGPHGIRPEVFWDKWSQAGWTNDSCVAFPALTCLAATWNTEMASLYGKSIGEEARYRKKNVLLGPGVNIARTPLNGRSFEYMGEDPYLSARMCVPYIRAVQKNGVATCVKHYALNNHEVHRHTTNVILDDRALYEIYLPAFKAAILEGDSWSIMGSYNLYQNEHGCHNQRLLNDILKGEWGFKGTVISDWGGTHDTHQAIHNGLDLEFGTWTNGLSDGKVSAYDTYFLANSYLNLINEGKETTELLNDKASRVLRLIFQTAMGPTNTYGSMCSPEHYAAAHRIATEGIVLLKNDKAILPIDTLKMPRILVVGENAIKSMVVGGGSSSLKTQREISPLQGIRDFVANRGEVLYARGYVGDVSNKYNGVVSKVNLEDERTPAQLADEACSMASQADIVIFIGGLNKSKHQDCEDSDRAGLELPYGQDSLIQALAKVNPNIVMVNISGNPVAMPWVKQTPAIIQAWHLGSQSGAAIADILFGRVNPSGKLPVSFPVKLSDVGAHSLGEYPGVKRENEDIWDEEYKESILVGYRWHDTKKISPLFAFGHGLSYTTFKYGKLTASAKTITEADSITFTIPVTNTGSTAGAEIVQLYISDPKCTVMRPTKELKGFKKIMLQPGETKQVSFTIGRDALSYFDDAAHCWVAEPGEFKAHAAAASDDIRSSVSFTLTHSGN